MNTHEIDRIAAAMNQLRPDWPTKQLQTLLSNPALATRPRRDVCVALAWVACETNSSSPYRVLEAGPWWRAAAVEGTTTQRNTFDPAIHCDVCSRPEHLHRPHDGHDYKPAAQHRPADVDIARKVALLRTDLSCTDPTPTPEPRKPAEPNPQVERLRAQIGAEK